MPTTQAATAASPQWTSSAPYDDSAWKTDAVQNAVATLNDDTASTGDQIKAYQLITGLITNLNSGSGPARYAVVQDPGFLAMINKVNTAQAKLDTHGDLRRAADIFDSLSPDEQQLATVGSSIPVAQTSDYLRTRAQLQDTVATIFKTYNIVSLEQTSDKKFDGLKQLSDTKVGPDWIAKAKQVLADLGASQGASQDAAQDSVTLSAQAQTHLAQSTAASGPAQKPVATSDSAVALQMLNRVQDDAKAAAASQTSDKPYQPGRWLSTVA